LSSTTSAQSVQPRERGQVLVLFAGGVFALLVVAALAFDVGMMLLERRDAQDAADAAALGAARYAFDADCTATDGWACVNARATAVRIASLNGFDDGADETVQVHIPPLHGRYIGLPNFVEVQIGSNRPSIFGGIIGRATWPVGAFAVATNAQDVTYPFSMIALNPTKCAAAQVTGTGSITASGNIQSNSNGSDCDGSDVGFLVSGQAEVNVIVDDATCRSAGEIQQSGQGLMTCTKDADSFILPDPLRNEPAPSKPALPASLIQIPVVGVPAVDIPDGCPGSANPATEAAPAVCDLGKTKNISGVRWLVPAGLYPGGLRFSNESIGYMLPGTFWIGGGGISWTKGGMVSVGSQADAQTDATNCTSLVSGMANSAGCYWPPYSGCTLIAPATCIDQGGVLIYNTELPTSPGGAVTLGGSTSTLRITAPMDDPNAIIDDIVIWQDKALCQTITINGSSSYVEVGGLIYSPCGPVTVNGNGGTIILDQIIADSFKITGNGGNITVLDRTDLEAAIVAAGLVD
jgi:hypothetical protein